MEGEWDGLMEAGCSVWAIPVCVCCFVFNTLEHDENKYHDFIFTKIIISSWHYKNKKHYSLSLRKKTQKKTHTNKILVTIILFQFHNKIGTKQTEEGWCEQKVGFLDMLIDFSKIHTFS